MIKYRRIKPYKIGQCEKCCFNYRMANTNMFNCNRLYTVESCCKGMQHVCIYINRISVLNTNVKVL